MGPKPGRRHQVALAAIASVGCALRLWKINWGLSDGMAFPDEYLLWSQAFQAFIPFEADSFLTTPLLYPTLYNYIVGILAGIAHIAGVLVSGESRIFEILLIARVVSVCAGVGTLVLVYLIGKRYYSVSTGLVAAALAAATPISVLQPHYASVDILLEVVTTLTLFATCALLHRPNRLVALLAGGAAGLAFSTKYTGLETLLLPLAAILAIGARSRSWRQAVSLTAFTIVGFAGCVALTCPPCVLKSSTMFARMTMHADLATRDLVQFRNNQVAESLGWYGRPYLFQLVAVLPYNLGWAIYAAFVVGLGRALRRRTFVDLVLLLHVTSYFLLISSSQVSFPRYLIPMLPACSLLAASALVSIPSTYVRGATVAVVVGYTLALSASQVDRFTYDQQESVALWINEYADHEAPTQSPVCGIATGPQGRPGEQMLYLYSGLAKPLQDLGIRSHRVPTELWLQAPVDFLVVPEWLIVSARRDEPGGAIATMIDAILARDSPYDAGPVWRSTFFTSELYTSLDPAFHADLWQGEIGFRVFVKKRPSTINGALDADPGSLGATSK